MPFPIQLVTDITNKFGHLYQQSTQEKLQRSQVETGIATLSRIEEISSSGKFLGFEIHIDGTHEKFRYETINSALSFLEARGYTSKYNISEKTHIILGQPLSFVNEDIHVAYKIRQQSIFEYNQRIETSQKALIDGVWNYLHSNGKQVFLRFGEVPACGKSYNFRDGKYEDGISCFSAVKIDNYFIVDIVGGFFTYSGYVNNKQAFEVIGTVLSTTGADGEPLLSNVKKVVGVSSDRIFHIKEFLSEVFNSTQPLMPSSDVLSSAATRAIQPATAPSRPSMSRVLNAAAARANSSSSPSKSPEPSKKPTGR